MTRRRAGNPRAGVRFSARGADQQAGQVERREAQRPFSGLPAHNTSSRRDTHKRTDRDSQS